MQGGIKRALPDLKHFCGDLLNALGDGPPVFRFKRDGLKNQEVKRTLHEVVWPSHTVIIYRRRCRLSRYVERSGGREQSCAFGEEGDRAAEIRSFSLEWFARAAAVRG
jgi:hypothetical protein